MAFQLRPYHAPNFTEERFVIAPQARLTPAPSDGIAPVGCHAMSIFPEYFKIAGAWRFAEESRMDCVAVWEDGKIKVNWPASEFERARGTFKGLREHTTEIQGFGAICGPKIMANKEMLDEKMDSRIKKFDEAIGALQETEADIPWNV